MTFIERYIEENYNDKRDSSPLLAGVAAGGIGYGLGTGAIQKGADAFMNQSPKTTGEDVHRSITGAVETIKNYDTGPIKEMATNAMDKISDLFTNSAG